MYTAEMLNEHNGAAVAPLGFMTKMAAKRRLWAFRPASFGKLSVSAIPPGCSSPPSAVLIAATTTGYAVQTRCFVRPACTDARGWAEEEREPEPRSCKFVPKPRSASPKPRSLKKSGVWGQTCKSGV
jgi:hypothetical protein